jgi:hypothetical protein
VAPQWVLTAAHCIDGAGVIDVLVGSNLLSTNEVRIRVDRTFMHAAYQRGVTGDIGLLHLAEPVTLTNVLLFDPSTGGSEIDYLRGTVTGWGNMDAYSYYGVYPDALQEVSLPLIDEAACRSHWGDFIGEGLMICAGYPVMTKSACYGDSGGPLMVQNAAGDWLQVGVVKGGDSYCAGTLPNLYTRVAPYRAWIAACIADMDSAACNGADVYEQDDTAAAAQLYATFAVSQTHTFHQPGDQDWTKFDVQEGYAYLIQASREASLQGRLNTVVWLFDNEGHTPLAYNDDRQVVGDFPVRGILVDSELYWVARRDGQLYINVENLFSGGATLSPYGPDVRYSLTIYELPWRAYLPSIPQPPVTPTPAPTPTFPPFATPAPPAPTPGAASN